MKWPNQKENLGGLVPCPKALLNTGSESGQFTELCAPSEGLGGHVLTTKIQIWTNLRLLFHLNFLEILLYLEYRR